MMSAHLSGGDAIRPMLSSSPTGMLDRYECMAILLV
jgi:hypothetical protein